MHKNIFKIFLKKFEIVEKGGFSEVKSLLKQKNSKQAEPANS